jgi:hypothetical protein
MSADLELTLMLADYHRTRPLLIGESQSQRSGSAAAPSRNGEACMRPVL